MIEALRTAADKVTAAIHEHAQQGEGFKQLCKSLGVEAHDLTDFVDVEIERLNGDSTPEGALMRGVLIGATVAQQVADQAAGTAAPLSTDGDLDWATIGMLLPPHEIRSRILRHMHKNGEASPNELAAALDLPLGNVSYHMRALAGTLPNSKPAIRDNPLVEIVREAPRRGAMEHYYSLTAKAQGGKEGSADA